MFLVIIAPAVFTLIIKVHGLVVINTFVIFLCEIYPNVFKTYLTFDCVRSA